MRSGGGSIRPRFVQFVTRVVEARRGRSPRRSFTRNSGDTPTGLAHARALLSYKSLCISPSNRFALYGVVAADRLASLVERNESTEGASCERHASVMRAADGRPYCLMIWPRISPPGFCVV